MSDNEHQFAGGYPGAGPAGERDRSQPRPSRLVLTGLLTGWCLALASGLAVLYAYEFQPGAAAEPPRAWPAATRLPMPADQSTLLMFIHPHCPCTRASVDELERLLPALTENVSVKVIVLSPADASPGWHRSSLWEACRLLPGVEVVVDREGGETQRFGVTTSGHVLLYDNSGTLQFSGGLTASRGHAGPSTGQSRLLDRARIASGLDESAVQPLVEPGRCLTFGCELSSAVTSPAAEE